MTGLSSCLMSLSPKVSPLSRTQISNYCCVCGSLCPSIAWGMLCLNEQIIVVITVSTGTPRHTFMPAADFLQPGENEEDINSKIFELTAARFGTRKHWHKRLVRTGENTIHPIFVDTPDRILQEDDIAFIDLGPVFGNLEADFARTYVIGEMLS